MSFDVINDLEATIKFFIEENIPELKDPAGEILFDSPVDITLPVSKPTLAIHHYRKVRNPYRSNEPIKYQEVPGHPDKLIKIPPPQAINLHYMFCVYDANREAENTILENICYYFKSSLILKDDTLQGSLALTGNTEIKIYEENLSLEDSSNLWGTFPNTDSRISLFYRVAPVLISGEPGKEVFKITKKEITVRDINELPLIGK